MKEYHFGQDWQKNRSWLEYDEEKKMMWCSKCREHDKLLKSRKGYASTWAIGQDSLRLCMHFDTIRINCHCVLALVKRHEKSAIHVFAVDVAQSSTALIDLDRSRFDSRRRQMEVVMKTVYR